MAAAPSEYITWREMLVRVEQEVGERNVAKWLCEEASGYDAQEFFDEIDELVGERPGLHLQEMLRRYGNGEPLQYVLGRWAFRHLDLMVDKRVLIPRPETEMLVDIVKNHLASISPPFLIADLGTGSGVIGLSLLQELPLESAIVWMTDASQDALNVAQANAAGLGRPAVGARFSCGNWCEALPSEMKGTLHAIVSNPPYIADGDSQVAESVLQWEPHDALFSGVDGLRDARTIIEDAMKWLAPSGLLAIEMGYTQGLAVQSIFETSGFLNVAIHQDLHGKNRFVSGIRS